MLKKATILIVDDIADNLKLLSDILHAEGYTIRPANSGELALISAIAEKPDMVLLDVRMPEMDGFEVCRRFKENPETSAIPIIFISAYDELSDRLKGFEVGGIDFLTKPFEAKEVLARIHTQLEINRLRTDLAMQAEKLKQINSLLQDKTEEIEAQNEELQSQTEELREQNEEYSVKNDELLKAQKMIEASEKKYRILFETMVLGVIYHNLQGIITDANKAAEKIFGMTKEQIRGKNITKLLGTIIHADGSKYPDQAHPSLRALEFKTPIIKEVMGIYNRQKSKFIWVNVNAIPQFSPGESQPDQVIVTYEDITDVKQAEAELVMQTEKLKISNEELSRFNRIAVGREMRMIDLKKEINELCKRVGEQPHYSLEFMNNDE